MSDVASIYASLRNAVANSQTSDEDILQIAIYESTKLYEQQRSADIARICSETGLVVDKFLPKRDQLNRNNDATNGISFDYSTLTILWASFKSAVYNWNKIRQTWSLTGLLLPEDHHFWYAFLFPSLLSTPASICVNFSIVIWMGKIFYSATFILFGHWSPIAISYQCGFTFSISPGQYKWIGFQSGNQVNS